MTDQPLETATGGDPTARHSRFNPAALGGFFLWDLLVVCSFVALGRDTHGESLTLGRSFQTAAPFLIALAGAWLLPQVRTRPGAIPSGLLVGGVTALLGLLLRGVVFSEGLSGAFPIIATGYLTGLTFLGRFLWSRRPRGG